MVSFRDNIDTYIPCLRYNRVAGPILVDILNSTEYLISLEFSFHIST